MADDTVEVKNVRVERETPRALLVVMGLTKKWIPKSVIHDDSEVFKENTSGTLVLQRWFAEKEGLDDAE